MSMDGLNHMVDDPFSGQRLAWQGELEKSIEQIAKLTAENAELRASEEAMSIAMGLLRDERDELRAKLEQAESKVKRDEMWDLLKKLEWIDYQLDGGNCTACNGRWPYHKPECIYVRKREEK